MQFDATFLPTKKGLELGRVLRQTKTGERLYRFLLDICLSMAVTLSADDSESLVQGGSVTIDSILAEDFSYKLAVSRSSTTLVMEDDADDENPTAIELKSLQKRLNERTTFNSRDILQTYQFLLKRRIA